MWIEANFLQNLGPSNRLLPFGEMAPRRKLVLMERRSSVRKLATVDANGNMNVDELGNELTYDAWNRLVKVESGSTVIAEYAYDALMRRTFGYGLDLYYSQNWQVLEDWPNGQSWASARYVWSIAYIDALVLRDSRASGSAGFDRYYALCNANWNVTSIVNLSAAIQERYIYDPYGSRSILDAGWSPLGASALDWVYAHQGGRLDVDAGLYNFRYRDLRPTIMRWNSCDPFGSVTAYGNLFSYSADNPQGLLDPFGLQVVPPPVAPPAAPPAIPPPLVPIIVIGGCAGIIIGQGSICIADIIIDVWFPEPRPIRDPWPIDNPPGGDPPPPPAPPRRGDCTPEEHAALQLAVNLACKAGKRACKASQDLAALKANYLKNLSCASARDAINNKCFKGGDIGHRQASADARRAAAICLALIEEREPDPVIKT